MPKNTNKKNKIKAPRALSNFKKSMTTPAPKLDPCKITVQDSVPIKAVHDQYNLIEPYEGMFTKSYRIGENNYATETAETENTLLTQYRNFMNSLGDKYECAITIFNKNIDMDTFREQMFTKETGDQLDYLRQDLNEIIEGRIEDGKNGLEKVKYITIGVHEENAHKADEVFRKTIDQRINTSFQKIQSSATPLSVESRLELIHDIYNMDSQGEFMTKSKVTDADGKVHEVSSFDFNNMRSMGCTIADLVGPSSMQFYFNYIRLGNKFARALKVTNLPANLSDEFFVSLTDVSFNIMATINIQPLPPKRASFVAKNNLAAVQSQKQDAIKNNPTLPEDLLNPELQRGVNAAMELLQQMQENDEKLFKTTYTVVIWADSKEELDDYTDIVISNCAGAVVTLETMTNMQEEGFNATLPLCDNEISYKQRRTLKSSSLVTVANPFSNLELCDPEGINYSCHLFTRNIISYNRTTAVNANGFIFGKPGCFDRDTEFFNGTEWKSLADYVEGDRVLQINPITKDMTLVQPSAYIKEPCDVMYHIVAGDLDMMLSPEHRVLYYEPKEILSYSGDDNTKPQYHTPKQVHETSAQKLVEDLERGLFTGYIATDKGYILLDQSTATVTQKVPTDLMKYCFTVPTHALVVRRNGTVFLSGNSGKSFSGKTEMINVALSTNSDIVVIDPEAEYGVLCKMLGGQNVKLVPGGSARINPLEITSNYEWTEDHGNDDEDEPNPVYAKSAFILHLMEFLINKPFGLDSIQKTIVDEALMKLYSPFIDDNGDLMDIPPEQMPTLTDLAIELGKSREPEARELALGLKLYTQGSQNIFGGKSTVDMKNRFIVFNIRDVGEELQPIAMLIIMDFIQNKFFENQRKGKNTWLYVDECHLLLKDNRTADFLAALWKRARKYGGVPTGITQNVSDVIDNEVAQGLIKNCNFVMMLDQNANDRDKLADMLQLSESMCDVLTSAPKGQGVLFFGESSVPFYAKFPKTKKDGSPDPIYMAISTTQKEVTEYREMERQKRLAERKKARAEAAEKQ